MIRLAFLFVLVFSSLAHSSFAWAVEPDEILADPVLEARARNISAQLRCLVCQNQSIDDSDAPLAKDLRILVRERLVAGDSDADVRSFLVARFGEFVLLKPAMSLANLLLWLTAPVVLLIGAAAAIWRARKSAAHAEADLSDEEERALAKILDDKA
jgi:cytochrome c-type biogenesis protein CcmH